MKQLILLISFWMVLFCSQGQLQKSNWLVGGTGSFYAFTSRSISDIYDVKSKYTRIDISPNLGYFVSDKLAFGLKPSFSSFKRKNVGSDDPLGNIQRYSFGPFGRYYFLRSDGRLNIVSELSYQFGWINAGVEKGTLHNFSALSGPVIFFNEAVGFEILVGYRSSKEDIKSLLMESFKGLQLVVGFQVYLGR